MIAALLPSVRTRRAARARPWLPLLGLTLIAAGGAMTVLALRLAWEWDWFMWILLAAVLVQLGLVALTPSLVGVAGRLAVLLPLPLRLSVRDASRHRVRTACAVAAITATVASVIAIGVGISSSQKHYRQTYAMSVPVGTLSISGRGMDDAGWAKLRAAAASALPGVPMVIAREATTAVFRLEGLTCVDRCKSFSRNPVPIGDERLLRLIQGRHDPAAAAALAAGKAVVFDARAVVGGKVVVRSAKRRISLPAVVAVASNPDQGGAVLPTAAVEAAGFSTAERRLYASHLPESESRLRGDLRAASGDAARVKVERGYQPEGTGYFWVLMGAAAVLVLGATFAATGLAAADLRPDLATMTAVGARPATARLVVAAQAGYISGLGALVGVLSGVVIGVAFAWPITEWEPRGVWVDMSVPPFTEPVLLPTVGIPWLFLASVAIGLPVLAALVAAACTRTGRPALALRLG